MSASPRVLLLCGGRSAEHEVSLASARAVLGAAGGMTMTPMVIGKDGRLLGAGASHAALALEGGEGQPAVEDGGGSLAVRGGGSALAGPGRGAQELAKGAGGHDGLAALPRDFDVVFPLLHGPFGEDGRVQGLLDVLGLPYVGSGVLGSALGMDKLAMKASFAAHGLAQVEHEPVTRHQWRMEPEAVLERVRRLGLPVFVKPANLGSSIGISRVDEGGGVPAALEAALAHDRRALVEAAAVGARELEVAVLGNDTPEASPVGEVRHSSRFYDYDTKYSDGMAELRIPASLPGGVADACRHAALRAFRAIDARGLARVDFFYLEESGTLLVNEINTMPGFTRHSMYPKLWEAAGVGFPELVSRLVRLAMEEA